MPENTNQPGIIPPNQIPYNDPSIEYVGGNIWGKLKTQDPNTVRTIVNPLPEDFVHRWGGKDYTIPAESKAMFPEFIALHLAKHLARKIYYEPYFSKFLPGETNVASVAEEKIVDVAALLMDREEVSEVIADVVKVQEEAGSYAREQQRVSLARREESARKVEDRQAAEKQALEQARKSRIEAATAEPKTTESKMTYNEFVAEKMKEDGATLQRVAAAWKEYKNNQ